MHIQCLLRIDGSIVAGVFLTSFFLCVVPESPYNIIPLAQQVAAYWQLGTRTALVQLVAPVALETGGCSAPQIPMLWFQTNLGHSYSPSNCCCNVSYDSILCAEPNSSPHEVSGDL